MSHTDQLGYRIFTRSESIKYESNIVSSVQILPVSHELIDIEVLEFEEGRFFNESEANSGSAVIVLGNEVAKSLFEDSDPIGKNLRLYGQRFTVIGILKNISAIDGRLILDPCFYIKKHNSNSSSSSKSSEVFTPAKILSIFKIFSVDSSGKKFNLGTYFICNLWLISCCISLAQDCKISTA